MGKRWLTFSIVSLLAVLFLSSALFGQPAVARAAWTYKSGFDPHGPYIDRIVWYVYPSEDIAQALLALKKGEIDAYDERIPASSLPSILGVPGVQVNVTLGTIYRQFTLNCEKFPTNITGYRRAIAYALDKYKVCEESTGSFAVPMDGAIPIEVDRWTYEDQMTEHFYEKDIASANASLEAAGFKDLDGDGWREYDKNGNGVWDPGIDLDTDDFDIEMMASAGYDPAIKAVLVAIEGMEECGIKGHLAELQFDALIDRLEQGTFDLGCFSWNINPPGDPDLLYDFFRTGQGYNEFFYRFHNATYDEMADHMMNATTYEDAKYYAWECQKILLEQMPMVTCYNDAYIHAFRTDRWEGWLTMLGLGVTGSNLYSYTHVRLKPEYGGPFGGELKMCLSEGMDTTNVIMTDSGYTLQVLGLIYEPLFNIDPYTWDLEPCIAYNWTIETTTASGDIQEGMKFTFKLYENATWHDGEPVTSEDVKYSFMTIRRYDPYRSPYVANIYKIETPDPHTVVIYSNKTGYFEFARACGLAILPKHVWEQHEGEFTTWVPETPDDLVGSGPFKWNSRVKGEYVILDRFENYHLGVSRIPMTTLPLAPEILMLVGAGIVVIVVIVAVGVYYFKFRKGG